MLWQRPDGTVRVNREAVAAAHRDAHSLGTPVPLHAGDATVVRSNFEVGSRIRNSPGGIRRHGVALFRGATLPLACGIAEVRPNARPDRLGRGER